MAYRGVIFDLDGTLVDSFRAIHGSLGASMVALGLPAWDYETTVRHVGRGIEYLVRTAVGAERTPQALEIFRKDYSATCLSRTFLLPSVADTLARLTTSGYRLAVATNKPLPFTRKILEHFKIDHHFDCVTAPEEVARPKPSPDMIHAILGRLRLSREECLYVGDMPLDVETATKAGVGCLLVATGAYSYSELTREVDVPVVESFSRILEYVERRKST